MTKTYWKENPSTLENVSRIDYAPIFSVHPVVILSCVCEKQELEGLTQAFLRHFRITWMGKKVLMITFILGYYAWNKSSHLAHIKTFNRTYNRQTDNLTLLIIGGVWLSKYGIKTLNKAKNMLEEETQRNITMSK